MHVGADTKINPTPEFCIGNCQQIVDTVVRTDKSTLIVVHTYPKGWLRSNDSHGFLPQLFLTMPHLRLQ
jgi:hypothetical protein